MDDLIVPALGIWVVAAWITHVVACINATSWALLFIGSIIFPIAFVHGTGIWFGLF